MEKFFKRISYMLIITFLFTLVPIEAFAKQYKDDAVVSTKITKKLNTNKIEGRIINEIISKREVNTKHFLKDDGTY